MSVEVVGLFVKFLEVHMICYILKCVSCVVTSVRWTGLSAGVAVPGSNNSIGIGNAMGRASLAELFKTKLE